MIYSSNTITLPIFKGVFFNDFPVVDKITKDIKLWKKVIDASNKKQTNDHL